MKILLATIEQSGTRFTAEVILGRPMVLLEREAACSEGGVLQAHLTDALMPLIREAATRMPVVTTARDPELIRASWERRGKDMNRLDEQLRNYAELLTLNPAVISLWGGFQRLPPPYMWFQNPTPQQVDEQLKRQPGFRM